MNQIKEIDNEKANIKCGTCKLFPCSRVPEKGDKACMNYAPPFFDYMVIDADDDQCAVISFIKWNYHIEYAVIINGVSKHTSYFAKNIDLGPISEELSKVLAELCSLPVSDMYLQALQAIDGLKNKGWGL